MRCAIVDTATHHVVNVIDYDDVPERAPPGFPDGYIAIASEAVSPGWILRDGALVDPAPPAPSLVPQTISDRQFFQQLAVQGIITQDEALAAIGPGTLPAALGALVSNLPAEQQFPASMLLKGAVQFERQHPMVAVLGQAFGWTSDQIDDLWRAASRL